VDSVEKLLNLVPAASTPSVRSVSIDKDRTKTDSGGYSKVLDEGDSVYVTVEMTEAVTVTGTPSIELNIGGVSRTAFFDSAESTSTLLRFKRDLVNADFDFNGISVGAGSINLPTGSTIQSSNGTAASRSYTAAVAFTDDPAYRVDTLALKGSSNDLDLLIKGKKGTDNNWYFFLDTGSQLGSDTLRTSPTPNGRPDATHDSNLRPAVDSIISNHNATNPDFRVQLAKAADLNTIATLSTNPNTNNWPTEWRTDSFELSLYHVGDTTNRVYGIGAGQDNPSFGTIDEDANNISAFAAFRVI
jgi:hypothetical protein